MFKGLHPKKKKDLKKIKKIPPPKPQIAIGKQQLFLMAFKCHTCFKKKNPSVEFGELLPGY